MMRAVLLITLAVSLTAGVANAQNAVGRIVSLSGEVWITKPGSDDKLFMTRGARVAAGDTINTGDDSVIRLRMSDGSVLDLGSSTRMTLSSYSAKPKAKRKVSVRLLVGKMMASVTSWFGGSEYEIETETAVAGVRGTRLAVFFDEGQSTVLVVEGNAAMRDLAGKISEALDSMRAGVLGPDGGVSTREVSQEELDALLAAVSPRPELSEEELEALRNRQSAATFGMDATRPPPLALPLEPGVGQTRTRGRVEVRDDQ